MLTVQGFSRVPEMVVGFTRDLRVLWALEELGLPYEFEGLDFQHLDTEAHRARSPFAQLPTIVDGDLVLSESAAILNYLAEKAGAVTDLRHRTELNRWSYAAISTIEPAVLVLSVLALGGSSDDGTRQQLTGITERHLGALDKRLAKQDYIVGRTFSIADILVTTVLRQIDGLGIIDKFPNVRAYKQRCEERPAFQKVLDAQEKRIGVPRGAARRSVPERRALAAKA
jgi:glutathione S-transferase